MWSLAAAQRAIIVAGCLAMAYSQLTLSPATIEYARQLGAGGLEIGILGALPTATLFMQFVAAAVVNRLRYRRRLWFTVSLVQRLIFVPVAIGSWLIPDFPAVWLWVLLAATAANHAMLQFASPLWLSWMGDYLPHRGLNRFWGARQVWMQWTAAASLLISALVLLKTGLGIRPVFALLTGVGAVLGVADLLIFLKIEEPEVRPAPGTGICGALAAPLKHPEFRPFIRYCCFWHFAAMWGAPFISLFLLDYVGMDLYHVLLLWTCSWIGGAICSGALGRLAEEFGHRPVLILCTAFKSINMIALLVIPADPRVAMWILVPVFMVDAILNTGIAIASNGFILKNSPAEGRTMFIAAGNALAGIVGGMTSITAGLLLARLSGWSLAWGPGGTLVGFHVVFAISLVLRFGAVVLAAMIREDKAHRTPHVVMYLVGATPMRIIRFPLGLYENARRLRDGRRLTPDAVPVADTVPIAPAAIDPEHGEAEAA